MRRMRRNPQGLQQRLRTQATYGGSGRTHPQRAAIQSRKPASRGALGAKGRASDVEVTRSPSHVAPYVVDMAVDSRHILVSTRSDPGIAAALAGAAPTVLAT
jgi:hypothetical protein